MDVYLCLFHGKSDEMDDGMGYCQFTKPPNIRGNSAKRIVR